MSIVIIGSGIAAISAVKAIRARDRKTPITLISNEALPFYYRPMIPLLISGKRYLSDIMIDFEPKHFGVDVVLGSVHQILPEMNTVTLENGWKVPYDKLLIASGAKSLTPDIPGIFGPGIFTIRSLADAIRIKMHTSMASAAVVIGAGLSGIKAALALKERGLHVTMIEQSPSILFPRADKEAAKIIESHLTQERGLTVLTNRCVKEIVRHMEQAVCAVRTDRESVRADMVVIATGNTPNISFLQGTKISTDRGVLVNPRLQTSSPYIYAAGDVVQLTDSITEESVPSGLWLNAVDMGTAAGINMAGGNAQYTTFLSACNAADLSVPFISAGLVRDNVTELGYDVFIKKQGDIYRKIVLKEGVPVGVLLINDLSMAGMIVNALRYKLPLSRSAIGHKTFYL